MDQPGTLLQSHDYKKIFSQLKKSQNYKKSSHNYKKKISEL